MANYMYKGLDINSMILNPSPSPVTLPTTVTGRYLKSDADYTPAEYFNSFHSATPSVPDLQFKINAFSSSLIQIYPITTCAQVVSYNESGSLNLRTNTNISSPTVYANRVYFILVGAGGGGGGGGHDAPDTDQNARGGGGGGAGGLLAKLIDTSIGPGTIEFTVGSGGAGGTRGFELSTGGSRTGGAGADGGDTELTYDGFTYTARGGKGGGGGIGADYNGSLADGGAGGTNTRTPGSPANNPLCDTVATGGAGETAKGDDTVPSSFAKAGNISFPFENTETGAYGIPSLGSNRGPGGAGGYGDHAPNPVAAPFPTVTTPYDGRGTNGESGSVGSVYLFLFFD